MVSNVIAGAAALAAIASIIVALRTYREQVRYRKTQWLLALRQRLLDEERFRILRSEILKQLSGAGESTALTGQSGKSGALAMLKTSLSLLRRKSPALWQLENTSTSSEYWNS